VTDYIYGITFDPAAPPGVNNTLTIILACTGETPGVLTELERYVESSHGALKKDVVEVVDEAYEGLRRPRAEFTRLRDVRKEKKFLEQVAQNGAKRTQEQEHLDRTRIGRRTDDEGLGRRVGLTQTRS
jgi:hypothetical protein